MTIFHFVVRKNIKDIFVQFFGVPSLYLEIILRCVLMKNTLLRELDTKVLRIKSCFNS